MSLVRIMNSRLNRNVNRGMLDQVQQWYKKGLRLKWDNINRKCQ